MSSCCLTDIKIDNLDKVLYNYRSNNIREGNTNKILYNLKGSSVTNLVYTITYNTSTSKTSYINSSGNSIL